MALAVFKGIKLFARVVCITIAIPLTGAAVADTADPRDFEGTWGLAPGNSPFIIAENLPYTEAARALVTRHQEQLQQGKDVASAHLMCRPTGVQGLTAPKGTVLIVQPPGELVMISQEDREVRTVYLGESHPKNVQPSYTGDSVARWEGATLVIDTIGFNGRGQLDEVGNPHSDRLHVVERWTKSADGNLLTAEFTFTDPVYYSKPFTSTRTYRRAPGTRVVDYDCAENPRADSFDSLTFDHDWFKPVCVRPVNKGVAAKKVVCTPPANPGYKR